MTNTKNTKNTKNKNNSDRNTNIVQPPPTQPPSTVLAMAKNSRSTVKRVRSGISTIIIDDDDSSDSLQYRHHGVIAFDSDYSSSGIDDSDDDSDDDNDDTAESATVDTPVTAIQASELQPPQPIHMNDKVVRRKKSNRGTGFFPSHPITGSGSQSSSKTATAVSSRTVSRTSSKNSYPALRATMDELRLMGDSGDAMSETSDEDEKYPRRYRAEPKQAALAVVAIGQLQQAQQPQASLFTRITSTIGGIFQR
ncbi:hypothetical protein GQ42DRAFT_160788 [Ramicandelaber brevisporus]|nr:hypothetical protein GQ42DRAFT_160788 [Ramicandelaber brevisporus]